MAKRKQNLSSMNIFTSMYCIVILDEAEVRTERLHTL